METTAGRNRLFLGLSFGAVVVLLLLLWVTSDLRTDSTDPAQSYTLTPLESLNREAERLGLWPFVTSMNDAGQVVGSLGGIKVSRAFHWDAENGVRVLETSDGRNSGFQAINNSGTVAGSWVESGTPKAILWSLREGASEIDLATTTATSALDINQQGAVLVRTYREGWEDGTFLLIDGEEIKAALLPKRELISGALTDDLTAYLWIQDESYQDKIYQWKPGTSPDPVLEGNFARPTAGSLRMNDRGEMALKRRFIRDFMNRWDLYRGAIFSASEGLQELTAEEKVYLRVAGINNRGTVAGSIRTLSESITVTINLLRGLDKIFGSDLHGRWFRRFYRFKSRAMVWKRGTTWDLNEMIPSAENTVLTEALAINNKGQIVCRGSVGKLQGHFLLTPINESTEEGD